MFIDTFKHSLPGLEKEWQIFMSLYQDDIKALYDKQWKKEDIYGSCNYIYVILQYIGAFYFAILIIRDLNNGATITDIEEDYSYEEMKRKLACDEIDLDLIINTLNI